MDSLTSRRARWPAARTALILFALVTLLLVAGSALEAQHLIANSLNREQATEAGREAQLVADLGLAAALASGRLDSRDLHLAAAEATAARRDLPLTALVLWTRSGKVLLTRGSTPGSAPGHRLPAIARAALASGRVQTGFAASGRAGQIVEAAVPLGAPGMHTVAEFDFSRGGVERAASVADNHLDLATGIAAVVIYLLLLPLLVRGARAVRLPADAFRRAASADLKRGLAYRELVLHYQPKVDIRSGAVVGVEALVRWNHPQRGLLAPGAFLPSAAGDPGLLAAFTAQVLNRAMADCARWRDGGTELPIAVNLATEVLTESSLIGLVADALESYRLDPHLLTLELTEDALMEHGTEVTGPLMRLRDLGVSLSIDDFGTGHSSLARLRSLPLDELKVDRSFIARITTDSRDLRIARHIVELGLDLDLDVVAEGVEDEQTLSALRELGCTIIQGFHIARPMPEDRLREWLCDRIVAPPRALPCAAPDDATALDDVTALDDATAPDDTTAPDDAPAPHDSAALADEAPAAGADSLREGRR